MTLVKDCKDVQCGSWQQGATLLRSLSGLLVPLACLQLTNCSETTGDYSRVRISSAALPMSALELAEVEQAGVMCDGVLVRTGDAVFEVLGRELHSYACLESKINDGKTTWVDPTLRKTADYDVVRSQEAAAFTALGKLTAELRERFAVSAKGIVLNADVWIAVDDSDVVDKSAFELSAGLAKQLQVERASRVAAAGRDFLSAIAKLPYPIEVVQDETTEPALPVPMFTLRAMQEALETVGRQPRVQLVATAIRDMPEVPASENYIPLTGADQLHQLGWHGNGIVVAHAEGKVVDSWANLVPNGACDATKCACPSSSATSEHPRVCMGVVRNTATTFNGVADGATVVSANSDAAIPSCTFTASINWAASKGATVINRSANTNNNLGRYLDYVATVPPYPLVTGATGNGGNQLESVATLRNGLAVQGAVVPTAHRADATLVSYGASKNPASSPQWELPHVTAPAERNDTAGFSQGQVISYNGTSIASPVVAGIAAALQHSNAALKSRPEAQIVGILVGADENIDEAQGGTWPLNVMDSFDDFDGVGLINGMNSLNVLAPSRKVNGGNTAVELGHDYGTMSSGSTPAHGYYSETYHALVPAGTTLRAAAILMARSNCGNPPDQDNCTTQNYPYFRLELHEEGGFSSAISANYSQNYQFASINNTSYPTTWKTYTVTLYLESWNTMTSSYWAVAWQAS